MGVYEILAIAAILASVIVGGVILPLIKQKARDSYFAGLKEWGILK